MMSDKLSDRIVINPISRSKGPTDNVVGDAQIPVVKRSTATIEAIKAYCLNNHLKPGDSLPTEATLCSILGVSRSSVREALRTLEALDIVCARQGLGWFVGDMSLQPMVDTLMLRFALDQTSGNESLRQVVALRRYLDMGIAPQVVTTMKGSKDPELDSLVAEMLECAKAREWYTDQDIAFHRAILVKLNNPLLDQLTSAMWLIHQAFLSTLTHPVGSLEETALAHQHMLEAARAGDLDAYYRAVNEHYGPLVDLLAEEEK